MKTLEHNSTKNVLLLDPHSNDRRNVKVRFPHTVQLKETKHEFRK